MNAAKGDFLLPVDKPPGPTSHDVVAAARRALGTKKVGHTGTLDPFASGLLVLCVGSATRLAEYLSGLDKRYEAVARLGSTTDTLDPEGEVISECDGWRGLDEAAIRSALGLLRGTITQVPPQYSAKKVDGEAMHRRARRGESVTLEPVEVTVYELDLVEVRLPDVHLAIRCSSGTYVRALARDLGDALGVGAHLTGLRRTAVGGFRVEDALSLEQLSDAGAVEGARIEPASAVSHLASVEVGDDVAARLTHGQRVRLGPEAAGGVRGPVGSAGSTEGEPSAGSAEPPLVAVTHAGDLMAIARLDDGVLRPRKVFAR